jgi:hypothetical protein
MKKILTFLALVCALTFIPLNTAKAGTVVYDTRPAVHSRVVVHYAPGPRVVYYRAYPHRVWYRHRCWRPYRYWGPRRYWW